MNFILKYSGPIMEEVLEELCKKMDIPLVLAREAVCHMFRQIRDNAKEKTFKDVTFANLGTFETTPRGIKRYLRIWGK